MKVAGLMIALALMILIGFTSCKHEVVVPTSPEMSFKTDVQPVLVGNCTQSGCHGTGGSVNGGGEERAFALSTYAEVMSKGRISPGNPSGSSIYTSITAGRMPKSPYPFVPDQQVLKLYVWILQGAKDN